MSDMDGFYEDEDEDEDEDEIVFEGKIRGESVSIFSDASFVDENGEHLDFDDLPPKFLREAIVALARAAAARVAKAASASASDLLRRWPPEMKVTDEMVTSYVRAAEKRISCGARDCRDCAHALLTDTLADVCHLHED